MFSIERRQTESAQCDKSSLISASTPVTSFISITTNSSNLQDRSHYPSNRSAAYSDGPSSPPSSSASSSSCFAISGSARYSSNIVGFRRGADPQSFHCIRLPPADSSGGFMTASNTSRLSRTLAMKRRKRIRTRSLCKYDCRRLSSNQDSDTDISNNYSSNSDDEYDTFNGFTDGYDVTKQHLPSDYPLQLLWRFCYCTLFCWFYQCRLWRSYFVLSILLFGGLSPALVMGEYPRVLIMVEKYADEKSSWEFHSRSSRQAEISRKTWNEYVLYKEQTCRTNSVDSNTAAADYFNWEEMTFHKKLRLKLLPPSLSKESQIAKNDAMMLSKIDSRLLAPEAESLCQMGTHDDSEQNEVAEKDKFEDTLISRIFYFPNPDDDLSPDLFGDDFLIEK